jgi:hypothetical protein
MPKPDGDDDYWLARPKTIRGLWIAFIVILAVTVLADFVIKPHGEFGIDGTIGFYAWYGFLSCVVLIFASLGLGRLLKRPDDYYDR